MTTNPLVAGPVDMSSPFGGTGVVESIADLSEALRSGSWLATGLAGVGATMDVVSTVIDPLGSLISAGLGWLMEHLEPLKGWLNDLTGDASAVAGFAATWDNIAASMGAAGDELDRVVRADLDAMSGASILAYAAYADGLAEQIRATGGSATALGSALRTCATVVQVVHDLVRDTLAQLVGSIISWAAEAVFTLGLATPVIATQVSTRVASLSTRIGRSVTDVLTSAKALKGLLEAMQGMLLRVGTDVRRALPGARAIPAPSRAVPGRHSSGLALSDGSRRNLYEQMMDPHVSPTNSRIVEADYEPFGGMTRDEFLERYQRSDASLPEGFDWDWPPNNGAVPGSEVRRTLTAADDVRLDRVGGGEGAYLSDEGTAFGQRALPPDRLNFERRQYAINPDHPMIRAGKITLEKSEVAPWFGQPGGGVQYRFFGDDGVALTQDMLVNERLLMDVVT